MKLLSKTTLSLILLLCASYAQAGLPSKPVKQVEPELCLLARLARQNRLNEALQSLLPCSEIFTSPSITPRRTPSNPISESRTYQPPTPIHSPVLKPTAVSPALVLLPDITKDFKDFKKNK